LYLEHLTDQAPHLFDYIGYIKAITGGEFLKESNAQPCNNNLTHTKEIKKQTNNQNHPQSEINYFLHEK
jgi:hypothetical protein